MCTPKKKSSMHTRRQTNTSMYYKLHPLRESQVQVFGTNRVKGRESDWVSEKRLRGGCCYGVLWFDCRKWCYQQMDIYKSDWWVGIGKLSGGGKELIGGVFLGHGVRKCYVFIGGFVLLFVSWWGLAKCFVLEIFFMPMKHVHTMSKYGVQNRRYWKGHTTKPLWHNFIVSDETYTCIFCKNLKFFESKCGACLFTIIGHLLSSRYSHLVMHVGLHNHLSVKGYSQEALDMMN